MIVVKKRMSDENLIPVEIYSAKWDDRWKRNVTPWDLGEPAPILVQLFQQNTLGSSGVAFVPGCGTGYEVTWIGTFANWSAVGMDISETAVQVAKARRDSLGIDPARAEILLGDFFTHERQYDLVFDHLFLCALQPKSRLDWARQIAQLVKPGGILIAYMYPINTHTDGMLMINSSDRPPFCSQSRHI